MSAAAPPAAPSAATARPARSGPDRGLADLLPAAEPVRDDDGVIGRGPDGGQDHPLTAGLRHLVPLTALEPEAAGHAAAPGIRDRHLKTIRCRISCSLSKPRTAP
jgi:hypothetical protein